MIKNEQECVKCVKIMLNEKNATKFHKNSISSGLTSLAFENESE